MAKASYHIEVPLLGHDPMTEHLLPEVVVNQVLSPDVEHKPLNPHKQRLLAAEARSANPPQKKPASKTKKGTCKAQKKSEKSAGSKKERKPDDGNAPPEAARTVYNAKKREFMQKFFGFICSHGFHTSFWCSLSHCWVSFNSRHWFRNLGWLRLNLNLCRRSKKRGDISVCFDWMRCQCNSKHFASQDMLYFQNFQRLGQVEGFPSVP